MTTHPSAMRAIVLSVVALMSAAPALASLQLVEVDPLAEPECDGCPSLVEIPGGRFEMGSTADAGEGPVRSVEIAPFLLATTETTVAAFRQFVTETGHPIPAGCFIWTAEGRMRNRSAASWEAPGYDGGDEMPVACVSWDDAQAFVGWLNDKVEGSPYRLPSEAEFEYALRGGSVTAFPWGEAAEGACAAVNGADAASRFRWRNTACTDATPDVAAPGTYPANAYGLDAISGNLWEWTADCFNPSHAGAPADGTARTEGTCGSRMLRGGSWDDPIDHLRSAYRVGIPARSRQANVGFRVARDPFN